MCLRQGFLYDGLPSWLLAVPAGAGDAWIFTFVTGDALFTPTRVPQGVMNANSYFQGRMMKVLGNLVGCACLIYVNDVKVIGRSVEELMVNLRTVLLRCTERALFLTAHKLVLFAKNVNGAANVLGDGRQTRPRAHA